MRKFVYHWRPAFQTLLRYPTFVDAVRDIDDALCMVYLFSSLPCDGRLPKEVIENCSRLAAEWQLYVIHSHGLRKAFLSIKGVYYQAEVMDQTVTWLTPYQFTQNVGSSANSELTKIDNSQVPMDVDVRVMLTFLELYQTLLSFVFFKLYTDAGLVYPPPLDAKKDDSGAGINALNMQQSSLSFPNQSNKVVTVEGRQISAKDVRQTIKSIDANPGEGSVDVDMAEPVPATTQVDEEFVPYSSSNQNQISTLPTLQTLSTLPESVNMKLFVPFTFWLSRETSRSIFEFVLRAFGGRVGWPASSGSGSPIDESDPSITHVIVDRPLVEKTEDPTQQALRARRKYIQPQWVIDCINAGTVLLEEPYGQGKTLPPHLSPFGEYEGAYIPSDAMREPQPEIHEEEDADSEGEEGGEGIDETVIEAVASLDPAVLRAAELVAEAAGVEYGEYEAKVQQASRKQEKKSDEEKKEVTEREMNKMMMSNRQKKLYEKMKYSQKKRNDEVRLPRPILRSTPS